MGDKENESGFIFLRKGVKGEKREWMGSLFKESRTFLPLQILKWWNCWRVFLFQIKFLWVSEISSNELSPKNSFKSSSEIFWPKQDDLIKYWTQDYVRTFFLSHWWLVSNALYSKLFRSNKTRDHFTSNSIKLFVIETLQQIHSSFPHLLFFFLLWWGKCQ